MGDRVLPALAFLLFGERFPGKLRGNPPGPLVRRRVAREEGMAAAQGGQLFQGSDRGPGIRVVFLQEGLAVVVRLPFLWKLVLR